MRTLVSGGAKITTSSEDIILYYQGMISYLRGDYRQAATFMKKAAFVRSEWINSNIFKPWE